MADQVPNQRDGNGHSPDGGGRPGDAARRASIERLVREHLAAVAEGKSARDEALIAAHPELLPELGLALAAARKTLATRPRDDRSHSRTWDQETQILDSAAELPSASLHPRPVERANESLGSRDDGRAPTTPAGAAAGDDPASEATTGHGLKVRCPHCHAFVDTINDSSWTDIVCSSCGSHFSLVDDTAQTRNSPIVTTVGHFDLIEQIGSGAFGTVWKARDRELDRTVAVKVPRKGQLEAVEAEQFLREARAAAQLHHPNIVNIHEVGRDGDTIFIVSDLVRGVSLSEWLQAQRPTPRQTAELCAKIADALDHAHQCGVIHRDLKPGNVMVDAQLEPHIMDFGLAKREVGELTMTVEGRVLGTPAYMSPEQARGEGHHADRRSDVYSLGVLMFQMLTGELPFRGNARMLVLQILNEEPPTPRKFEPTLSRDLETICLKCLEKSPERRYDTARDAAAELRRYLNGEPILARPAGRVERMWRWAKRYPVVASLSAAVAALLFAVAVVASFGYARANNLLGIAQLEREAAVNARAETQRQSEEVKKQRDKAEDARRDAEYQGHVAEEQRQQAEWLQAEAEDRRQEADRLLYGHKIRTLCSAWESQSLPDDITHLLLDLKPGDGDRSDPRGWEWSYLYDKINTGFTAVVKHEKDASVKEVAWSPDGKLLATVALDNMVRVWDATKTVDASALTAGNGATPGDATPAGATARSFAQVFSVAVPRGSNPSLAFSPDGKRLAMIGGGLLQVVTVAKPDERLRINTRHGQVVSVAWSPDGQRLATVGLDQRTTGGVFRAVNDWAYRLQLWNATTGVALRTIPVSSPRLITWSPKGDWIALGNDSGHVYLHKATPDLDALAAKDQETPRQFSLFNTPQQAAGAQAVDRRGDETDPNVERIETIGGTISDLAFSSDGARLAIASGGSSVRLWNVTARQLDRDLYAGAASAVAWGPKDEFIVTVGGDGFAKTWDLRGRRDNFSAYTPEVTELRKLTHHALAVAWSPGGQFVAAGCRDGQVRVWDVKAPATPPAASNLSQPLARVTFAWNPNGRQIASVEIGQAEIRLWNVAAGTVERTLTYKHKFGSVAWNHDGTLLLATIVPANFNMMTNAEPPPPAVVFDVATGQPKYELRDTGGLASSLRRWARLPGLITVAEQGLQSVVAARFSPDGKSIITAHRDPTVRQWDAATGELTQAFAGHYSFVSEVAWRRDGKRFVSGGWDGQLRVWDPSNGRCEQTIQTKLGNIYALAYSPDGKRVATAGGDNLIWVWRLADGKPEFRLSAGNTVRSLAFNADGRRLAAAGNNGVVTLWDTFSGQNLLSLGVSRSYTFTGLENQGLTVGWSPDGKELASLGGSTNGETAIVLWSANKRLSSERSPELAHFTLPGDLVKTRSTWRYLDDGSDQGTAWIKPDFNDASWKQGNGKFGYGEGDEATVIQYGSDRNRKHLTTYFRHTFDVEDPAKIKDLVLGLVRDDGAAVYLNGKEVARSNLPAGAKFSSRALSTANDGADEAEIYYFGVDPALLVVGRNVLAAEVHQHGGTSSDMSFEAHLNANILPRLIAALQAPRTTMERRMEAVRLLGKLGPYAENAVPALLALPRLPDSYHSSELYDALGQIARRDDLVVPALIQNIQQGTLVESSARALANFPLAAEKSTAILVQALGTSKPQARVGVRPGGYLLNEITAQGQRETRAIESALARLAAQSDRVVPAIVAGYSKLDSNGRTAAIRVFARTTADLAPARELLQAAAKETLQQRQRWAQAALQRLQPDPNVKLDLLALVDLDVSRTGNWRRPPDRLVAPSTRWIERLPIYLVPPRAYRVTAVVSPEQNAQGWYMSHRLNGRSFLATLDAGRSTPDSGLELVNNLGLETSRNPTRTTGRLLRSGQRNKIEYTIRPGHVTVVVNDRQIVDWQGNPTALSQRNDLVPREQHLLNLLASGSYSVYELTLTPLTTEGSGTTAPAAPAAAPTTPTPPPEPT